MNSTGQGAVRVVAGLFLVAWAGVAAGQAPATRPVSAAAARARRVPAAKPTAPARPADLVLSGEDTWRKFYTFFPPALSVKAAEAKGLPNARKLLGEYRAEIKKLQP